MTEELVLRKDDDGLSILTLNRPKALNALNPALFVQLRQHIDDIAKRSDDIGAVLLCGKGRSFSAGNDIKSIMAGEQAPSPYFQAETLDAIEAMPQPVIAAVQGHCYTGSLELVLACDLIIAGESARFADTHGKFGMSPIWGMSQRLPRRVGIAKAKEMMYTGRPITGIEAMVMGLANACVPDDKLMDAAIKLGRDMLANSWFTLRADKMLISYGLEHDYREALRYERENSPGRDSDIEDRLKGFKKE